MRTSGRVTLIFFPFFFLVFFLLIVEIELRPKGGRLAGIGLALDPVLLVIIMLSLHLLQYRQNKITQTETKQTTILNSCNMIGVLFILTLAYYSDWNSSHPSAH